MLLRSSSTPILSEFSTTTTTSHHQPISCRFSPISGDRDPPSSAVRRTLSNGNLFTLFSDHPEHHRHHHHLPPLPPSSSSSRGPTTPSFPMHHTRSLEEDADQRDQHSSGDNQDVGLDRGDGEVAMPPLFLARGLGIDRLGSGLMIAEEFCNGGGGDGREEQSALEMHLKKMVEEDPTNALFLGNYAQFLYQVKGDLQRAEEYYSRAILSEPGDGETLSHYAKLVWELHRDDERTSSYFEQAVHAAPQDSQVLAAYAGFLWEAEEDDCAGVGDRQSRDYEGSVHH